MPQNKSVEETLADVLCEEIMVSPKNKAEETIKATIIKAYRYGQRQTSQEREQEIVKAIKAKRPQQYMGRVGYMEGYDNAIDDMLEVIKNYQP